MGVKLGSNILDAVVHSRKWNLGQSRNFLPMVPMEEMEHEEATALRALLSPHPVTTNPQELILNLKRLSALVVKCTREGVVVLDRYHSLSLACRTHCSREVKVAQSRIEIAVKPLYPVKVRPSQTKVKTQLLYKFFRGSRVTCRKHTRPFLKLPVIAQDQVFDGTKSRVGRRTVKKWCHRM